MKNFIIISGTNLIFAMSKDISDVVTYCQNVLDQSNEIIVREYKTAMKKENYIIIEN